ncbi:hypothetical protein FNT36_22120 [Hymenobacter setariae]|uniref:Uncharacterized protein n=1 Tax=Hymenobacter setariae TaxID=2594794 RepID=A0A558BMX2_9BACT|nr:hypothetical protein [Hymenobacter setariae]TVT37858.1 hypothetical protein FNT36_22120 [Hymenobacter setariae]
MAYLELQCIQCGEQMEGRANKKFCSAACRAQHFRDNQDSANNYNDSVQPSTPDIEQPGLPGTPAFLNVQQTQPYAEVVQCQSQQYQTPQYQSRQYQSEVATGNWDWAVQFMQEQDANREREKIADMHRLYSNLVVKCLKVDGTTLDDNNIQTWINELDYVSSRYRTNPALSQAGNQAHERLEDLYWLIDKFRRLLEQWKEQPILLPSKSYYPPNKAKPVLFELSSKRRNRFRSHLLP